MKFHLSDPPLTVPPTGNKSNSDYRKSPYIIQAACAGNIPTFRKLLEAGCKINEFGHICLSKKRKNSVLSTVIGAAAYHGKNEMLKYLLASPQLQKSYIEVGCSELQDIKPIKAGPLSHEYQGYTPLQLVVVSAFSDLETLQILLQQRANTKITERETGNNLYHLAAIHCTNFDVFQYIVKNVDLDLFERNKAGETLASLVKASDDKKRYQLVEEIQNLRDRTKLEAAKLLEELMSAE
jgi:ankyrin repeat protein